MQFLENYSGHFARLTCNHSYGYAHCLIFMGPIEQIDSLKFPQNSAFSYNMRASCSDSGYAEIMLHYVETGVEYTNTCGDIDSPFYSSMTAMYSDAANFINTHSMVNLFQERLYKIVIDSQNCGWGFYDGLVEVYYDVISAEE